MNNVINKSYLGEEIVFGNGDAPPQPLTPIVSVPFTITNVGETVVAYNTLEEGKTYNITLTVDNSGITIELRSEADGNPLGDLDSSNSFTLEFTNGTGDYYANELRLTKALGIGAVTINSMTLTEA